MKVILNKCFGGFELSPAAIAMYSEKKGTTFSDYFYYSIIDEIRKDPDLISIVEELGGEANGWCSKLVIVDIPDELDGKYVIDDYDGIETLHEDVPVW